MIKDGIRLVEFCDRMMGCNPVNKKWQSVAKWPYPQVTLGGDNTSTDNHYTKEEALGAIRMLEKDGFGGNGNIYPIETFVQEIPEGS